jgi:hypothetical protein
MNTKITIVIRRTKLPITAIPDIVYLMNISDLKGLSLSFKRPSLIGRLLFLLAGNTTLQLNWQKGWQEILKQRSFILLQRLVMLNS